MVVPTGGTALSGGALAAVKWTGAEPNGPPEITPVTRL